jgi:lysophospholipase L1-like esterase
LGKGGTAPAVELHKGDIVVAGLASATQQGLEPRCPARGVAAAFGHTEGAQGGKPLHACPGYAQAMAMMLGFVDALVASEQPMRPGPGTLTLQLDGVLAMPLSPPPTPAPPPTSDKPARTKGPDSVPDEGPRALTPLFAFGDSWLASLAPLPDLPSQLPAQGYEITRSDALRGRTLEEMARRAHAVAASLPGMPCKAILLCGGGNDLVWQRSGPQDTMLYRLLDPKATAGVRARDLKTFIAELGGHFRKILDLLLTATNGDPVPILVHGYGDPAPDGRPAKPSHPFTLGPWLKPVFGARGMVDQARNTAVMGHLVTELNTMLDQLARDYARTGLVHHVDLRAVLGQAQQDNPQPPPAMVYTDWADELHPSTTGYAKVAAALAERLGALKVAPWQPPTAP